MMARSRLQSLQRWEMARRIQTLEQKKHSWTK
jgi:hypothetical protein